MEALWQVCVDAERVVLLVGEVEVLQGGFSWGEGGREGRSESVKARWMCWMRRADRLGGWRENSVAGAVVEEGVVVDLGEGGSVMKRIEVLAGPGPTIQVFWDQ